MRHCSPENDDQSGSIPDLLLVLCSLAIATNPFTRGSTDGLTQRASSGSDAEQCIFIALQCVGHTSGTPKFFLSTGPLFQRERERNRALIAGVDGYLARDC